MVNDIQTTDGKGRCTAPLALDTSAAFGAINHSILCQWLQYTFGMNSSVLDWLRSFMFPVAAGGERLNTAPYEYAAPQGSVLGPLLFLLYVAPVSDIAAAHHVSIHQYADDIQTYIAFQPWCRGHCALPLLPPCNGFMPFRCSPTFLYRLGTGYMEQYSCCCPRFWQHGVSNLLWKHISLTLSTCHVTDSHPLAPLIHSNVTYGANLRNAYCIVLYCIISYHIVSYHIGMDSNISRKVKMKFWKTSYNTLEHTVEKNCAVYLLLAGHDSMSILMWHGRCMNLLSVI